AQDGAHHHVDGITISTHGSGRDWGTDVIGSTIDEVRATGASWVCVHPYAWIRNDGTVEFRRFEPGSAPAHLIRPIDEAHRRGVKIMIKPHLGYWGSAFAWRGAITFTAPEQLERFWRTYTDWIVEVAAACKDADAFVVGTELDRLLDEAHWREIIRRVREVTQAPLTYAANWTDYRHVPFWDALDVIGIQAYFPIADTPTADESVLREGWRRRMRELREFAEPLDKFVVFTELGYNRSFSTAVEPWNAKMDGDEAEATQLACMRVALESIRAERLVLGAFLWKWFPGRTRRVHDFYLRSSSMLRLLKEVWTRP
ncbi:MAG: hypothetical protein KDB80_10935, partial [Planctomycetes bacterium]|nr:hypothetical protein [Planctomycetota bacterium]